MNKRYFIVWALCLFSSMILAQTADDYHPFAQDGKIWEIQIGGIKENVYGNTIDGDTIIMSVPRILIIRIMQPFAMWKRKSISSLKIAAGLDCYMISDSK